MILPKDDITVIIRTVGERTTDACFFLVRQIFPAENITIIKTFPFSKAIEEGFTIALKRKKAWLLCIDADVLVSENGVNQLLHVAASAGENVFEVQGLVLDKFFRIYRPAGNHLYRTRYVERARQLIPIEGSSLRPEADTLKAMSSLGFPHVQCDAIIGLHDYDQFFIDIYRKSFLQAHKHVHILPLIEKHWLKHAKSDPDFEVALGGSLAGKLYNNVVYVDKRFLHEEAMEFLKFLNLREKPDMENPAVDKMYVEEQLSTNLLVPEDALQDRIFDKSHWNSISNTARVNDSGKALPWKLLNRIGDYMVKVGKKLKSVAR